MTTVPAPAIPPRPRSRGRARIVVATLAAIGFAALAWASFVSPLPRLPVVMSSRVSCERIRAARRATSGGVSHRAGILP